MFFEIIIFILSLIVLRLSFEWKKKEKGYEPKIAFWGAIIAIVSILYSWTNSLYTEDNTLNNHQTQNSSDSLIIAQLEILNKRDSLNNLKESIGSIEVREYSLNRNISINEVNSISSVAKEIIQKRFPSAKIFNVKENVPLFVIPGASGRNDCFFDNLTEVKLVNFEGTLITLYIQVSELIAEVVEYRTTELIQKNVKPRLLEGIYTLAGRAEEKKLEVSDIQIYQERKIYKSDCQTHDFYFPTNSKKDKEDLFRKAMAIDKRDFVHLEIFSCSKWSAGTTIFVEFYDKIGYYSHFCYSIEEEKLNIYYPYNLFQADFG